MYMDPYSWVSKYLRDAFGHKMVQRLANNANNKQAQRFQEKVLNLHISYKTLCFTFNHISGPCLWFKALTTWELYEMATKLAKAL